MLVYVRQRRTLVRHKKEYLDDKKREILDQTKSLL